MAWRCAIDTFCSDRKTYGQQIGRPTTMIWCIVWHFHVAKCAPLFGLCRRMEEKTNQLFSKARKKLNNYWINMNFVETLFGWLNWYNILLCFFFYSFTISPPPQLQPKNSPYDGEYEFLIVYILIVHIKIKYRTRTRELKRRYGWRVKEKNY